MNSELLLENKELREKNISKDYVLDKVKALVLLPGNIITTMENVADYYEVKPDAIEWHIRNNYDELISDGFKVLKGEELKQFKKDLKGSESYSVPSNIKYASVLSVFPRRAILRLGMLLEESIVAKKVRDYLLNVEENADMELKMQSLLQANNNKLIILQQQGIELINQNNWLLSNNKELNSQVHTLQSKVSEIEHYLSEIKESFIFRQYENPSFKFNELIHAFGYKFNIFNEPKQFSAFYKVYENWTDTKIPYTSNTKDYLLKLYKNDISIIEKLINGILIGRIVESNKGNWIDLSGYTKNNIEFERVKREFDYKCAYCGKSNVQLLPEHMIPKSKKGSTDIIYNIVPACKECNDSKFDNNMKPWFEKQGFFSEEKLTKLKEHWSKYFIKV